jgi:hypothetical protein
VRKIPARSAILSTPTAKVRDAVDVERRADGRLEDEPVAAATAGERVEFEAAVELVPGGPEALLTCSAPIRDSPVGAAPTAVPTSVAA